jgi:UDPglucose--hexose-1-phosphate uridylyltransferase
LLPGRRPRVTRKAARALAVASPLKARLLPRWMMNELRQDPTSGLWVIIAPERGHRPYVLLPAAQALTDRPPVLRFDSDCPFCPGHEHRLPGIIAEIRMPDPPGWSVRVVPNKFPAVQADSKTEIVELATQHRLLDGYGFHRSSSKVPDMMRIWPNCPTSRLTQLSPCIATDRGSS